MKRDRCRLRVEPLESRALLSGSMLAAPSASVPAHVAAASRPPVLSGTIRGTYTVQRALPDAGSTFRLAGSGLVQGLGQVQARGSIFTVGYIPTGRSTGTLTLSNARGSVVLALQGPTQGAGSAPPSRYHYDVRSATGAFAHLIGTGTIGLVLRPALTAPPGMTTSPGNPIADPTRGAFTLTIQPDRTPPPTVKTGISGVALAGPISPVERPGVPNERPLAGAIITVQPGGGRELARVTADATGHFRIALRPGSYRIVPLPPRPGQFFPRGIPQDVVVHADEVVEVTVRYDTGIR